MKILFLLICAIAAVNAHADQSNSKKQLRQEKNRTQSAPEYDRMEVLGQFLEGVYPELPGPAMFNVEAISEGNDRHVFIQRVTLYPCRALKPVIGSIAPPSLVHK